LVDPVSATANRPLATREVFGYSMGKA